MHVSEISAFSTLDALLQYKVLHFGFKNAPAMFQHLILKVLANVNNYDAYLDDVVCYSGTGDRKDSRTLNLAKCEFYNVTVKYLGKEVSKDTVRRLETKV